VDSASAVIADYGASDRAAAKVLFGVAQTGGKLPFELPHPWKRLVNSMQMYR